jgi:hypothetical protein
MTFLSEILENRSLNVFPYEMQGLLQSNCVPKHLISRRYGFYRSCQGGNMRLQASRTPATGDGAARHGHGGRQGRAPAWAAGLRVSLATLEGGAAESTLAHGCV